MSDGSITIYGDAEIHLHYHDGHGDARALCGIALALAHQKERDQKIMSLISEYAAKQQEYNAAQSEAIGKISEHTAALAGDLQGLKEKLDQITGNGTAEDLALIVKLKTEGQALVDRAQAASNALIALDEQTPPEVPVEVPAEPEPEPVSTDPFAPENIPPMVPDPAPETPA